MTVIAGLIGYPLSVFSSQVVVNGVVPCINERSQGNSHYEFVNVIGDPNSNNLGGAKYTRESDEQDYKAVYQLRDKGRASGPQPKFFGTCNFAQLLKDKNIHQLTN